MTATRRKIVYLTGTRADFGLMKSSLLQIAEVAELSIAVTGMHLHPAFGNTIEDIRATGLRVCGEVPVDVVARSAESMSMGIGDCLKGVTRLLQQESPDILLLLGDRGEMLAGAIAALHLGLVCVHIHGGERSGTVDEPVRHAISKLSTFHFVATDQSRERLVRMGESPERIFVTGAPGLDDLAGIADMSPVDFQQALGLPDGSEFVLALFHPVVQQREDARVQTCNVLAALQKVGLPVVWAEPNSDAGSRGILDALDSVALPPGSRRVTHLQRDLFCSAMKRCAVLVGNSSAGIIEAASFGTPVVNIGDRQRLRERNANVTDVAAQADEVCEAIRAALRHGKWPCDNSYGDGFAGQRIRNKLLNLPLGRSVLEKTNTY